MSSGKLAYSNRLTGYGTWADEGSAFSASPPIANLGTMQTPGPYAEFSGTSCEFSFAALDSADAAEDFTFSCLALIGLDIADGATITWKTAADATIATAPYNKFRSRAPNHYILLSAAQTMNTVKCAITNAGTGTHRIAAAFAGRVKDFGQLEGVEIGNTDGSQIAQVDGTDWPFAGARRRGVRMQIPAIRANDALGITVGGVTPTDDDWQTILDTAGTHAPIIYFPRTDTQEWIDSLGIYGRFADGGTVAHVSGEWFRVEARIQEQI